VRLEDDDRVARIGHHKQRLVQRLLGAVGDRISAALARMPFSSRTLTASRSRTASAPPTEV